MRSVMEIMIRKEIRGTGVKLINIQPGFVNTEGCRAVFSDDYSRDVMEEFGYGGADTALMLNPGDIADTVWDVVNKPDNVYVEEVMIKDMFRKV